MVAMAQIQEEMWDTHSKCVDILEWAQEHPDFNTEFVENVMKQIEDREFITGKQAAAIDNILFRWNIEL